MSDRVNLSTLLGIEHAILQAPMGGGATTPELVAAVSNAGGLGMLGAAYLSPAQIIEAFAAVRKLTDRPFGVNLFAGGTEITETVDPRPMLDLLARYHQALDLPPPTLPEIAHPSLDAQFAAVLAARVPVFSFTFGIPSVQVMRQFKEQGTVVLGTATTVAEARLLEEVGVHAVVTQGSEAGAHRGTFIGSFEDALVGTVALVPQVVDAVSIPVIASGGIMDGRGIVAMEALGAGGVQLGTAFLTCREAGIPAAYQAAIRAARDDQTVLTRAFSGRPARGIRNDFIDDLGSHESEILPFPLQNAATRPLRGAAAQRGDTRYLSLWAGQAAALARDMPAGELVHQLVREAAQVRTRLATGAGS